MLISGKVVVALADYFEDHFEYTINRGNGTFPTIVRIDELRDFLLEHEYPKEVLDWAERIPAQSGQIKRSVLACREQPELLVRFAEDILGRESPPGRYVDDRTRKRLTDALEADGFTLQDTKLWATTADAEKVLANARRIRRGLFPPPVPTTSTPTATSVSPAKKVFTPREAMAHTVGLARKCVGEDGKKPKVAALVTAEDGTFIGEAYRGELREGEHAEYTLLERKLKDEMLVGAIVYTTLEPCTTRGEGKVPCADRLRERKIKRVVIGMVDPNPDIRGVGQRHLQDGRIEVGLYDHEFTEMLEELNRDFTRHFTKK